MSTLNVDKVDPSTGTALELGTSGDTISVPSGATLDISASTLTPPATMPASSGINFTALNATNLGSGTVPTARLGTGTASSSTVLYGDQTYKTEPTGGKILQVVQAYSTGTNAATTSSTYAATGLSVNITPSATSSSVMITGNFNLNQADGGSWIFVTVYRDASDLAPHNCGFAGIYELSDNLHCGNNLCWLDTAISTTSQVTYQYYFRNGDNSGNVIFNQNATMSATIQAWEIAG